MPSKINFEEHENYLQISYSGYEDISEFLDSLDKALEICSKNKYSNLILDVNNVDFSKIQDMDKFYAGEKIAKLFNNPNLVKVIVIAPIEFQDKFTDTVATNRGAIFKTFDNKDDAIEWINK
jgi:hypothetical protein